jgi:predicted enzyme related to lactoylglutathione lyase
MDMGPDMGKYQMYGLDGKTLGGMYRKPPQSPGPPAWLPYIKVGDAKKAAQTIKSLKGTVINGPMEVPGGDWIAQGLDLEGAVFAVHSVKPAVSSAAASSRKRAKAKKAVAKAVRKRQRPRAAKKVAAKAGAKKKGTKKKSAKKKATRTAAVRPKGTRNGSRRRPAARSRSRRPSRRGR